MLWIYDEAIVKDLANSIDPSGSANNTVRMMGDEGIMGVLAQLQEGHIKFPAIFLNRNSDMQLDPKRFNFTRTHKGVPAVFDSESNNLYLEKSMPVNLSYELHALTTNTADMDEIVRELLFKYSSMYYVTAEIPYESKRKIRFGVAINPDTSITRKSGLAEYLDSGRLYESIIQLECQGAVYIHYTPRHLQRAVWDKDIVLRPTLNNGTKKGV